MATHVLKQFVHARKNYDGTLHITLFPSIWEEHGRVFLFEQDFNVELPDDLDLTPGEIAALRRQKAKVLAEAQKKVAEIDESIARLTCLEHKS